MQRLDESALRRADFQAGYAVELADGQRWTLPPVKIRICPDDDGETVYRPWYGGNLEDDLDILFGVVDATHIQYIEVRLKIAAALLKQNYDLPKGAIGHLLGYVPGDEASESMMDKISVAIIGRDPDAVEPEEPGGDDPKGSEPGSGDGPTTTGSS